MKDLQIVTKHHLDLLTPSQVLRAGAFGGTYFRKITSGVTGKTYSYKEAIKEYQSWFRGLDIEKQVARPYNEYDINVNKYKRKSRFNIKTVGNKQVECIRILMDGFSGIVDFIWGDVSVTKIYIK